MGPPEGEEVAPLLLDLLEPEDPDLLEPEDPDLLEPEDPEPASWLVSGLLPASSGVFQTLFLIISSEMTEKRARTRPNSLGLTFFKIMSSSSAVKFVGRFWMAWMKLKFLTRRSEASEGGVSLRVGLGS